MHGPSKLSHPSSLAAVVKRIAGFPAAVFQVFKNADRRVQQ